MTIPIVYTADLGIAKPYQNQSVIDTTVSVALDILDAAIAGRLARSVAGSIDVTLTAASITGAGESTNAILEFTGVLTGSINVNVPALPRIYVVYNNTSGAFTLKVKTPSGTGVFITQGDRALIECDGSNVVLLAAASFGYVAQNSKSAAYTTVLSDAGKQIYHPGADTTARVWTIDSNANVPYPIGTEIFFVNDTSGGVITIAITADTLVLAGAGTTGSRTLAASGMAKAVKITATRWMITNQGGLT